jgi:hypothetical protein
VGLVDKALFVLLTPRPKSTVLNRVFRRFFHQLRQQQKPGEYFSNSLSNVGWYQNQVPWN